MESTSEGTRQANRDARNRIDKRVDPFVILSGIKPELERRGFKEIRMNGDPLIPVIYATTPNNVKIHITYHIGDKSPEGAGGAFHIVIEGNRSRGIVDKEYYRLYADIDDKKLKFKDIKYSPHDSNVYGINKKHRSHTLMSDIQTCISVMNMFPLYVRSKKSIEKEKKPKSATQGKASLTSTSPAVSSSATSSSSHSTSGFSGLSSSAAEYVPLTKRPTPVRENNWQLVTGKKSTKKTGKKSRGGYSRRHTRRRR